MVRELDIRATNNADGIDDSIGIFLQLLLQRLGDGQHGSDAEAVAGMHAHRIDVLDETDSDHVALPIPYHFKLQLFPAQNRLLNEDLPDQTRRDPASGYRLQLFNIIRDPAAGAAERIRGSNDHGIAQLLRDQHSVITGIRRRAPGYRDIQHRHRLLEGYPVFATFNRVRFDADYFNAVLSQNPQLMEF